MALKCPMLVSILLARTVTAVQSDSAPERSSRFKNVTTLNNGAIEIEDNNLSVWSPKDPVEVYVGEYILQHIELSSLIPFTVSHMGVVFQNVPKNKWYVVDFFAHSAETIANVVSPSIPPYSAWYSMYWWQKLVAYMRGGLIDYLAWDNMGYVHLVEEKNSNFHELVNVGSVYGSEVKNLREWLITNFTANGVTFDMWSVYDENSGERILESRNCHDFVEVVLQQLKFTKNISPWDDGKRPDKIAVFRDSLALTVKSFTKIDISNNAKKRRDYQRFLRFLKNHVYEAARDLTLRKFPVTKSQMLGIKFIIFSNGINYYELEMSNIDPLNYCRLALDFEVGKEITAVPINDDRKHCYLPHFQMDQTHQEAVYLFQDYLIAMEQYVDDLLFGDDGKGVPVYQHFSFVFESTIIIIALTKLIKWISSKKRI